MVLSNRGYSYKSISLHQIMGVDGNVFMGTLIKCDLVSLPKYDVSFLFVLSHSLPPFFPHLTIAILLCPGYLENLNFHM